MKDEIKILKASKTQGLKQIDVVLNMNSAAPVCASVTTFSKDFGLTRKMKEEFILNMALNYILNNEVK